MRIADYILSQLASDEKSLEQADYIFKGVPCTRAGLAVV